MAEGGRAYDFSKFEDTVSFSAAAVQPQRKATPKKEKPDIVKLPRKELEKNRRPKINPIKAVFYSLVFTVVMSVLSLTIYNQVQLTELTEKIATESAALEKAKALEVELGIKMAEKMNSAEIETYARENLGMNKMTDNQVIYVNLVQEDKGEVLSQEETGNMFAKIWSTLQSWFS